MKPAIIASLGLEGAKEWRLTYSTENEWDRHPNHPKQYLIWADFDPTTEGKDGINGKYSLYEIKVLDTTECEPRSERLTYALGRVEMEKWYFDETYGTIDSKRFGIFKESNWFEETHFFRTRMEQLLLDNK